MNNRLPEDRIFHFAATGKLGGRKSICFAAQLSGLYRSTNGGRTWESAFGSLNLQAPLAALTVVLSPDFEHDPHVYVGLNGGILCSSDGGENWENVKVPSPPPVVSALAVSPNFTEDGTLFAATMEDGVLYSSDRGRRWASWNFGLLDLNTFCLALSPNFANDETLFVGTQSGIFRSTNGGRAWREVNLPIGFESVLSLAISPNFIRDHTLFAGTENRGLLLSTDGGQTWDRLGKSRLKQPVNSIHIAPNFPKQRDLLILHGSKLLTSTDEGKTWTPWRENVLSRKNVTAILAPRRFIDGDPALVGLEDGTVLAV